MALNYTRIFTDVGKYLKAINQIRGMTRGTGAASPNLPTLLSEIETELAISGRNDVLNGTVPIFESYQSSATSWISSLVSKITERLTERESVVQQLPGLSNDSDTATILHELCRKMVEDFASVQISTVTIGAVAANGMNRGSGIVATTRFIDGVTPPGASLQPSKCHPFVLSELSVPSETMTFTCIQDEDSSGAPSGQEVFRWDGQPKPSGGAFGWESEGSGESLQVFTANSYDVISNREFELWNNNNVPANWTVYSGAPGVNIMQETDLGWVFRGNACLKFYGAGEIQQTVNQTQLVPLKRYVLSAAVRGAYNADGTLEIGLYTLTGIPGGGFFGGAQLSLDSATLISISGDFDIRSTFIDIPATIPEDLLFRIKYSGSNGDIHVDSLALAPVTYANGIGASILAGKLQFVVGDRFTLPVTNTEGVFQAFFRRAYGLQLPSSVTPTISDTLAG